MALACGLRMERFAGDLPIKESSFRRFSCHLHVGLMIGICSIHLDGEVPFLLVFHRRFSMFAMSSVIRPMKSHSAPRGRLKVNNWVSGSGISCNKRERSKVICKRYTATGCNLIYSVVAHSPVKDMVFVSDDYSVKIVRNSNKSDNEQR